MTGGLILYEINKLVMQLSNVWERKNNSARYFNHRIAVCCYFLPLLQYMINIMFKEAKNYVGQTALTTWKRSRRLQELVGSRRRASQQAGSANRRCQKLFNSCCRCDSRTPDVRSKPENVPPHITQSLRGKLWNAPTSLLRAWGHWLTLSERQNLYITI